MRTLKPAGPTIRSIPLPISGLAEVLVKALNVHEGRWRVGIRFGHAAIYATVNGTTAPTALVSVQGVELQRLPDTAPLDPLSVDAAEVNPASLIVLPTGRLSAVERN